LASSDSSSAVRGTLAVGMDGSIAASGWFEGDEDEAVAGVVGAEWSVVERDGCIG